MMPMLLPPPWMKSVIMSDQTKMVEIFLAFRMRHRLETSSPRNMAMRPSRM